MEKLEKHIKKQFQERKIAPSNKAWQKVAAELGDTPQKNNRSVFWYMVAASALVAVFLLAQFFGENDKLPDNLPNNQKVVGVDTIDEEKEPSEVTIVVEAEKVPNVIVEKAVAEQEFKTLEETNNPNQILRDTDQEDNSKKLADGFTEPQLIIDKKVEEVLAQVTLLEDQSQSVTDAEIDSLLRAAQQEILGERLFDKNGSIDATALLLEVEDELNKSFRDELFDNLKERFFKLRTAVADRNN